MWIWPKKAYNLNRMNVITRAIACFERTYFRAILPITNICCNKNRCHDTPLPSGYGLVFWDKLKCGSCHEGWLLTNQGYANNGLYLQYSDPVGKGSREKDEDDAAFKIPSLLNVSLTSPYMFDGSLPTLSDVIDHYASGRLCPSTNTPTSVLLHWLYPKKQI